MPMEKQKYEIVLEAIEAGNQTTETLMELLEAKSSRSVSNQFKFINVLKKFPVLDEATGFYKVLDEAAYEELLKTQPASKEAEKKWTVDPQAKKNTLESRFSTKISRMNAAKAKVDTDPDNMVFKLRNTIAECEFHLANIALTDFQKGICTEINLTVDEYKEAEDLNVLQETAKAVA